MLTATYQHALLKIIGQKTCKSGKKVLHSIHTQIQYTRTSLYVLKFHIRTSLYVLKFDIRTLLNIVKVRI